MTTLASSKPYRLTADLKAGGWGANTFKGRHFEIIIVVTDAPKDEVLRLAEANGAHCLFIQEKPRNRHHGH